MCRFRRRLGHDHEAKTHCTAPADALNQTPNDHLHETHRAAANARADGGEYGGDDPDWSGAEDLAHHGEEELAGGAKH